MNPRNFFNINILLTASGVSSLPVNLAAFHTKMPLLSGPLRGSNRVPGARAAERWSDSINNNETFKHLFVVLQDVFKINYFMQSKLAATVVHV